MTALATTDVDRERLRTNASGPMAAQAATPNTRVTTAYSLRRFTYWRCSGVVFRCGGRRGTWLIRAIATRSPPRSSTKRQIATANGASVGFPDASSPGTFPMYPWAHRVPLGSADQTQPSGQRPIWLNPAFVAADPVGPLPGMSGNGRRRWSVLEDHIPGMSERTCD